MKRNTEYWVEYDFSTDCNGRCVPNLIRAFNTETEANKFAVTVDGKVVKIEWQAL